jgi:hypothetical protein
MAGSFNAEQLKVIADISETTIDNDARASYRTAMANEDPTLTRRMIDMFSPKEGDGCSRASTAGATNINAKLICCLGEKWSASSMCTGTQPDGTNLRSKTLSKLSSLCSTTVNPEYKADTSSEKSQFKVCIENYLDNMAACSQDTSTQCKEATA